MGCPPAELVSFIADHRNELRWNTEMVSIEPAVDGPPKPGARFADTARVMGLRVHVDLKLLELDPDGLVRFGGQATGMRVQTTYAVHPDPDGTRLVFDFVAELHWALRPFRWAVQQQMDRRFDRMLPAMRREVETGVVASLSGGPVEAR
jgi:hypothetical protein